MIRPARLYVTPLEVLAAAGRPTDDTASPADVTRAESIAELASIIVEHVVGERGTILHLLPTEFDETTGEPTSPPPSGAHEAALVIAVDVWRRPTTPGGYFQVADYVGRLSTDPASPVIALLSPYRESWAIA